MGWMRSIPAMFANDGRRLLRDQFLLGSAAYIFGISIALRWILPWLENELRTSNGFEVAPYFPLGVSYFVLVNASVLTGMVGGFLLLEQREERTLQAMMVTQTPITVLLGALASVIVVTGATVAMIEVAVVGHGTPPWSAAVASAWLCAPTGMVMALVLATLADNKVEAFAMIKIVGFIGLTPVIAYFVPEPWQYLAGVFPPYWACKIWWVAAEGGTDWAAYLVPGVLVSAGWVWLLVRRFLAVV